jgi:hypothetical protein
MPFTVRTAKADRQAQLTALHEAHAHIETYVPAADDSHLLRYADHFFVTNQDGWENKPTTVRVTCATEDIAKSCAVILTDAAANGYWREKRVYDKKKKIMVVRSRAWARWSGDAPVPVEIVRLIDAVIHPGWVERAKPKEETAAPAPAAA